MAYGVTAAGWVTKPFAQIRADIEDRLRNGDVALGITGIDPLLDCSDQTPMGQIVAVLAGEIADLWEAGADAYAARYPDSADGSALDEVASITGTTRDAAVKTQVVGQVTLTASTTLPAGSVAHLTGRPNDRFVTLAEVVDGGSGGTYNVTFEAETAGPLDVLAGQLDQIAEPVSGWTAVDNAAGATVSGSAIATDSELRLKRAAQLALGGSANVDAIRAALLDLQGVLAARVVEDLANHTIAAYVRGGTAQDIYDALLASRAAGITSVGTLSGTAIDEQGISHTESYTPAVAAAIHVDVTVVTDPSVFDETDGIASIKARVEAYIDGVGSTVGADVIHDLTKCAVFEEPGVTRITVLLQGIGAASAASDVALSDTQYATCDVANVAVTVT